MSGVTNGDASAQMQVATKAKLDVIEYQDRAEFIRQISGEEPHPAPRLSATPPGDADTARTPAKNKEADEMEAGCGCDPCECSPNITAQENDQLCVPSSPTMRRAAMLLCGLKPWQCSRTRKQRLEHCKRLLANRNTLKSPN